MTAVLPMLLLALGASAAELWVDVRVPGRVLVNGEVVAILARPAELRVRLPAGTHELMGSFADRQISTTVELKEGQPSRVLLGRTGASVLHDATPEAGEGPAKLQMRVADGATLRVYLGDARHRVGPMEAPLVELESGTHKVEVRSEDGTAVYARGRLVVPAGAEVILQIVEGGLPEVSGRGARFIPDGV